jgi:hypothetical protein
LEGTAIIRVELHNYSNNLVKVLSGAKNASYHEVLNSDGAGTFLIHRADSDVAALSILSGGIDGYIVHLLRKGPLETAFTDRFSFVVESVSFGLDESEEGGAWITIAGRGTLCLLEDRMAYPPGYDGVLQSTVSNQWQVYTATAGGAIMGGEITRSNGRFALALTHSVDTTTVPQTVTLRFDNLRKLHDYLVGNGMDAQMVGLDYQAADNLGTDKSASVTVRLSSQDSLRGMGLQRDARPVKNYVVAQGTGEGINATLKSSSDATSITALRRREGFLDASQDSDPTQLGLRASSAVKQLKDPDQRITSRFIDSTRTQLYRDFGLGDTITLAAQPWNLSASYRCVGLSVADLEAEVEEISLDLNDMRQEYLLKLATSAALTADSLNVLSRMPQGSAWNDSQDYDGNCTPAFPFHFRFFIPTNVLQLNYAKFSFFLLAFRTDYDFSVHGTGTESAGHSHGSAAEVAHSHTSAAHAHHNTPATSGYSASFNLSSSSALEVASGPSPGWSTDSTTPGSTGSTTPGTPGSTGGESGTHTHTVSGADTAGITEWAIATGVTVKINGVDRTVTLGGGTGFTADQIELEIGQWLTLGALNTIDLTPTGLGKILGHLRLTGYIQSD